MSDISVVGLLLLWVLLLAVSFRFQEAAVQRVEHKLDILIKHSAIDLNLAADAEIERLIKAGKKWAAIKYYRELTGVEKKAAQQHADEAELRLIQQKFQS